ncbi:MAG TPA: 30S ribosomal protein S15 [bacterium]|uniref:Small ribosomal subunit protein uS15 n=1 Tax=candidate division TA06 bacterium ADurb.Bin417 TaxID=1852828 RepID=A0A1V5MIM2_UNCT6|nr:MAG: 30S ribosomal protein S15 [candidate division TA06 bacterium ADurb.Bin417]HNQ34554.1 30S ribosomal protein S15 [bacterium]HNS49238.1 30S ribosomal protein S15 [bacterium]
MLTAEEKTNLISSFHRHGKDTGSPEVQISLLTERINRLGDHFRTHAKDHNSRRGLLVMIGQRRKLLSYLKRLNPSTYDKVISKLGLRK